MTFNPGDRVIILDAWRKNPKFAIYIKRLGQTHIADTARGIRLSATDDRIFLADDLFSPADAKDA